MGGGNSDSKRVEARAEARARIPVQEVFKETKLHPGMDPNGLMFRESRDGDEHPDSIAVVFNMDITGSMGTIPRLLATEVMHEFMPGLARVNPHVQVLFAAIGDADDGYNYPAPWQNGQFETDDALADEWLTRMWLEGSGGSAPYESYDLAFYFLGWLTQMDCFEKRGKKGYAFLTGDDICRGQILAETVNRLLGRTELQANITIQEAITRTAQMYHVFFLIPDPLRARNYRDEKYVEDEWRKLLGQNGTVVVLADARDTAVVSSVLFGLTEGAYASIDAVRDDLRDNFKRTDEMAERVIRAVAPYAKTLGIK